MTLVRNDRISGRNGGKASEFSPEKEQATVNKKQQERKRKIIRKENENKISGKVS
jgi:hypothetical protein